MKDNIKVEDNVLQETLEYVKKALSDEKEEVKQDNGDTQMSQIIKSLADSIKSSNEIQKSILDRIVTLEGKMNAPVEVKEEVQKAEVPAPIETKESGVSELTELVKSLQTEIVSLKNDINTPVQKAATGISTLQKSFGGEPETAEKAQITKSQVINTLTKAFANTGNSAYSDAVTLFEFGGDISKAVWNDALNDCVKKN